MVMTLLRGLTAVVLCVVPVAVAHAAESVWDALRAPGSVVVLRHSYAPGGFDPPTARLDDCSTQRNLDANGRAQAARVGEAFRRSGIEIGVILSSPRCRCLDTGRLAFGRAQAWEPLQGALDDTERRQRQLAETERRQRQRAEIRHAIAAHRDSPVLVLITHGSVVSDLTGLNVRMGAFVVLRCGAGGTHSDAVGL